MNVSLRPAGMTRDQFFTWAQARDGRYEFDGCRPVAMTGGSLNHNRITLNLHRALHSRLHGTGCEALGPDAGVATTGETVRYPDAVVTCTQAAGTMHLVPDPLVVFEVVSPTSGSMDRIIKVREYKEVGSIRRYVILDLQGVEAMVLWRGNAGDWTLATLVEGNTLPLPELGFDVPVADLYAGTGLCTSVADAAPDA